MALPPVLSDKAIRHFARARGNSQLRWGLQVSVTSRLTQCTALLRRCDLSTAMRIEAQRHSRRLLSPPGPSTERRAGSCLSPLPSAFVEADVAQHRRRGALVSFVRLRFCSCRSARAKLRQAPEHQGRDRYVANRVLNVRRIPANPPH